MSEVEPKSYQPDDVENYEYWVSEGVLDECKTICWVMTEACTQEFSKHHVVPEVEEVKQKTENDDDTKHQHILACPLYLLRLCCYLVTLVTASTTVLCCQDESINDVTNSLPFYQ